MFRLFCFTVLLTLLTTVHASTEEVLKDIYKSYVTAKYQDALEKLNHLQATNKELQNTKLYWQGLCFSRLQNYPEAIRFFEVAKRNGNTAQDLDYEYGQALYAMNQLEKARMAFEGSAEKKFKPATSYYYVGHISQLLEEYPKAKTAYEKILKDKEAENSLTQFSRFQLGEVILAIAEKKEENKENKEDISLLVQKYVLPHFEKAILLNPDSTVAQDIKRREDEIKKQYGLDPNVLANGRQLPPQPWELSLSQKVSYDNNVTQATDLPTVKATQKESFIFDTEVFAKYRFTHQRRFVTSPEIRITRSKYGDQENAEVYSNDSYSLAPALRFKDEHKLFGEMASLILDFEYNYTLRDRLNHHSYAYYGGTWSESIGEKFKLFSFGETTLKLKLKQYSAYDTNLNSQTFNPSLTQIIFLQNLRHLLLMLVQSEFTSVEDDTQSATNHLVRFDYIIPEFYTPLWSLQLSFALTFTDPKTGKDTRGLEKTYNPGLKLTRNFSENFQTSISYDYTKKTSKDESSYAYTKNVTAFELRYSF